MQKSGAKKCLNFAIFSCKHELFHVFFDHFRLIIKYFAASKDEVFRIMLHFMVNFALSQALNKALPEECLVSRGFIFELNSRKQTRIARGVIKLR